MSKKLCFFTTLCLLSASALTNADEGINYAYESAGPKGGFFVGLGGSYNSVKLEQHLRANGVFEVSRNSQKLASGFTKGKSHPKRTTKQTFAPVVQAGYFSQLECSDWAWGGKVAYKYLGIAFTDDKFDCWRPCELTWGSKTCKKVHILGDARVEALQTRVDHQVDFRFLLGHTINCGHVYLGLGPVLFGTKHKVYRACGNIDFDHGSHFANNHKSFSKTKWKWGGAAQVGVAFNLACDWCLDLSYDYARSASYSNKHRKAFKGSHGSASHVAGVCVRTSEKITSQSFTVAINKAF